MILFLVIQVEDKYQDIQHMKLIQAMVVLWIKSLMPISIQLLYQDLLCYFFKVFPIPIWSINYKPELGFNVHRDPFELLEL